MFGERYRSVLQIGHMSCDQSGSGSRAISGWSLSLSEGYLFLCASFYLWVACGKAGGGVMVQGANAPILHTGPHLTTTPKLVMATILELSFPYKEGKDSLLLLRELSLTLQTEESKLEVEIQNGRGTNIKLINASDSRVKYVDSCLPECPLLICVPPAYSNMQLNLSYKSEGTCTLLVMQSAHPEEFETAAKEYSTGISNSETSLKVCIKQFEQFLQAQSSIRLALRPLGGVQHIAVWKVGQHTPVFCFLFAVNLEVAAQAASSELQSNPPRAAIDLKVDELRKAFNFSLDDGPEFRSTIKAYEKDVLRLRKLFTTLNNEVRLLDLTLKRLTQCRRSLASAVEAIVNLQFNSLLQKLEIPKSFARQLHDIFSAFEKNMTFFVHLIVDIGTISKMASYANAVAPSEGESVLKKSFEKNSKEFYEWLNRYLLNERERPELKLLRKRKIFELAKFDYLNSLNLASSNQYFNQFLENLFVFSQMRAKNGVLLDFKQFSDKTLSQSLLSEDAQLYFSGLSRFNSEKLQLRQKIEACLTNNELTELVKSNPLNPAFNVGQAEDASELKLELVFPTPTNNDAHPVQSALDEDRNGECSGILYALGGKGKPGWHKEWVVLRNGRVTEYSDWRKGQLPINQPIDVALASVKPVNYDKRLHCFEILTSSGHKHVFQATSDDELSNWIRSLYSAGQVVLNLNASRVSARKHKFRSPQPMNEDPDQKSPVSIRSHGFTFADTDWLSKVRAKHSNAFCADCGSSDGVEWVSLGLLVVVCVQCSSCHRNMGSHISAIRSLKLDHFRREHSLILEHVDNGFVNSYLEVSGTKIEPSASDDQRLLYIQQKYIVRAFSFQDEDIDQKLASLVRIIDIPSVGRALNLGADANLAVLVKARTGEVVTVSLFEYSLRKLVQCKENGEERELFVISELLLLHGCNIDSLPDTPRLAISPSALEYWKLRRHT